MNIRKQYEKLIVEKSNTKNINGYVQNIEDNLIKGIDIGLFANDLNNGKGNELEGKFKALYSSSALTVNNFACVKKYCRYFEFLNFTNFNKAGFEREFDTGLFGTPPTLDFYLENEDLLIAFESKYLEPLEIKKVNFSPKYKSLKYLNNQWLDLIDKYQGKELNLDVAQLLKHSFGLMNYKNRVKKKIVLFYIYWLPKNHNEVSVYIKHRNELETLKNELCHQNDIAFECMSYIDFWNKYEDDLFIGTMIKDVKERYFI